MLAYAISAAVNSNLFREVIVSSDDAALGLIAQSYGANFVLRPRELATDSAALVDVAKHVLEIVQDRGIAPEAFCQCMPNCPLLRSSDIVEHWHCFNQRQKGFQISVVPYRGVYPHWALITDKQQNGQWLFGQKYILRSQELASASCPTGAIWWARTSDFLAQSAFYGSPFALEPIDANRGIDIDDEEDLKLAELLVHGLTARDGESPLEPVRRFSLAAEAVSG